MIDFLMSALRRHLRSVVISPIGEGKVVVLDISCFGPWRAFSMTDRAENIWVLCCETENISTSTAIVDTLNYSLINKSYVKSNEL